MSSVNQVRAELRFYAELKDFLAPEERRTGIVVHTFDVPGSVKDAVESHGVPHTEVDLVVVGGVSVDFSYRLEDGDRAAVYPVFEAIDIAPVVRLRPEPLREVRFVLDGHLGKLARYLRLVGFDTVCDTGASDHELVRRSVDEHRILLTRDVGLLKHGALTHGTFVRAVDPRQQLGEVIRRFHLSGRLAPFTRCMECNGLLVATSKAAVAGRVPAEAWRAFDEYTECTSCGRVYWRGSHFGELESLVAAAREADGQ